MVAGTTASHGEQGGARNKALEIGCGSCRRSRYEEYIAIVAGRQAPAHSHPDDLTAKTELVRPASPAYGVEPHKIIRERRLQLRGIGPKFEGAEV